MDKHKIVTINGQRYDAQTGLPIAKPKTPAVKRPTAATSVHAGSQRSQTLVRRVAKKPVPSPIGGRPKSPGRMMDIAPSASIKRFAPHPTTPIKKQVVSTPDIAARPHHLTHKVVAKPVAVTATSQMIKQRAIDEALAKPAVKPKKKKFTQRHPRLVSIASISIIIAILGAYLTYVNMPSLSVRVAAAQAGIDASYPEYRPDGYSLNGPVTFSDGEVSMSFVANAGTTAFIIKQAESSWDSSAVLDNIVRKAAGEKYITSQEGGLTIYTYGGNAAWVNAGILYTIEGDAPLSGEQIRRIATSL